MVHEIESVLVGRRVEAVAAAGRLTVVLTGGLVVTVLSDFRLRTAVDVEHFYPGLSLPPSGALTALVGAGLDAAAVTASGGLELTFDGGRTLSVPPDSAVPGPSGPWRVEGPDGPLFTAEPGGYLSV